MYPPYARGGAESVADVVSHIWPDTFVITAEPFQGLRSFVGHWETVDGVRVFRFWPLNLFSIFNIAKYPTPFRLVWHVRDMFNIHTFLMVRRALLQEKPDIILSHNLKGLGYTIPAAIRSARWSGWSGKWLHTIHDMGALHPTGLKIFGHENNWAQTMLPVRIYARVNAWLFGSPDVVISPSRFLLEEYISKGFFVTSQRMVIHNPVSVTPVLEAKKPVEGAARFLYIGQLEPYKGLRTLLEAWKDFSETHPEAQLQIAGQGSMQKEIEEAARRMRGVRYLGFLSRAQSAEAIRQARFVVLPTLAYENSPTIIGESFSVGVPVIASRIGGIPELIIDHKNGLLFTPGDQQALLQVLSEASSADYNTSNSTIEFTPTAYRTKIEQLI